MFIRYLQDNQLEGEHLMPWPKVVHNGIEWAKLHLASLTVNW